MRPSNYKKFSAHFLIFKMRFYGLQTLISNIKHNFEFPNTLSYH